MVLPGLDGSLRQVAAMVVWGDELESHVGVTNFCSVGRRDFVIQNLVFWDDALKFHSGECPTTGQDHFSFSPVFHGFDPCGITIDVVNEHLVLIAATGAEREFTGLIGKHGLTWVVYRDEDFFK